MKLKFWGVRGSIPTPEHRNSRYGGNTACIEVRLDNGTLLVFDCGTGLRGLGKSLLRNSGGKPVHAHIFLTHFHWDHIQGLPFFLPLYREGSILAFHSIRRGDDALRSVIEGQMVNPYFPVDSGAMTAKRAFFDLDYGNININGALITSAPLNHPQGCAGFRIKADGCTLVYATDNEPGSPEHDRSIRDLARDADLLIYDAQYTPVQLRNGKGGWGHSSWLEGARIANECGVRRLILFHHDPDRDDESVDNLVRDAREVFPQVVGAAEGMEISLPEQETILSQEFSVLRHEPRYHIEVPALVTWHDERGERREAHAIAQNVSKSGIYFVSGDNIPAARYVDVELVFPPDVTQRGPMKVHFAAHPIRQQKAEPSEDGNTDNVGIAALRISSEVPPEPVLRFHTVA